jgi:hypothetical protein
MPALLALNLPPGQGGNPMKLQQRANRLDEHANVRASGYLIAQTGQTCSRCGSRCRLYGIALPAGHETRYVDDEAPHGDTWEVAGEPSLLSFVSYLPPHVVARMRLHTPHYRPRFSPELDCAYWMNGCEHCGARLDDHDAFDEPGLGFLALSPQEAARISLTKVDEPIAAACGSYSIGIEFFEFMRRA